MSVSQEGPVKISKTIFSSLLEIDADSWRLQDKPGELAALCVLVIVNILMLDQFSFSDGQEQYSIENLVLPLTSRCLLFNCKLLIDLMSTNATE